MNAVDEERVIRALHTLTTDLVVTERDVAVAHEKLRDRLQPVGPTRRTRVLVAAAVIAAAVGLGFTLGHLLGTDTHAELPAELPTTAPSPQLDVQAWDAPTGEFMAGRTPTTADLTGLWRTRVSDQSWLTLFGATGYTTTTNGGDLHGTAGNSGTWRLDGDTLTVRLDQGFCEPEFRHGRVVFTSRVVVMPDGSLHALVRPGDLGVHPKPAICRPAVGDRMIYDRVAPGPSRLVADLRPDSSGWASLDPARAAELRGVWVSADGSWLLTVGPALDYRAYRNGDPTRTPLDAGRLEIGPDGRLTATCRHGSMSADAQLTYSQPIDGLVDGLPMLRGEYAANSCPLALGETLDWRRVSDYWSP